MYLAAAILRADCFSGGGLFNGTMRSTMEDDGFLSEGERDTLLPSNHGMDPVAPTVHSAVELVKQGIVWTPMPMEREPPFKLVTPFSLPFPLNSLIFSEVLCGRKLCLFTGDWVKIPIA